MTREEKIGEIKQWLQSGTSGFEKEKAETLLSELNEIQDYVFSHLYSEYSKKIHKIKDKEEAPD